MIRASDFLVVIPTLNEIENLPRLINQISLLTSHYEILVIDDGSIDGTVEFCEKLSQNMPQVKIVNRGEKLGLASAYKYSYSLAKKGSFKYLVQMDADGSHRTQDLEKMANYIRMNPSTDLVIGSRWVQGGKVVGWPMHRHLLSRTANVYANLILGLGVQDSTAGFRIYRLASLSAINLDEIFCEGYGFQIEMTESFRANQFLISELGITFTEREFGVSKMSRQIVFEAFWKILRLAILKRLPKLR